jgi:hypothetical protein
MKEVSINDRNKLNLATTQVMELDCFNYFNEKGLIFSNLSINLISIDISVMN